MSAQTARLIGGPAHGRVYAMPEGEHTLVVAEADRDITAFLAEWDPLEALYDPPYGLAPVSFSQHTYTKRHFVRAGPHPCVPGIGLCEHRYPWLHQDLDPDDPLVTSWVLAEPVDRAEWLVWEFGTWHSVAQSTRGDLAAWLAWASPDDPWWLILSPAPEHRKGPSVADAADYLLDTRKRQARTAAERARILYPGPVGEMLARELDVWAEFAYRFTGASLIDKLIDHLLDPKRQVDPRGTTHPGNGRPGG